MAGFHTEYSAMTFGLFFLGEYANMILLSALGAVLFLGGWHSPIPFAPFTLVPGVVWFALKIAFLLFIFSWTKGTLPRYRYDQLMRLGLEGVPARVAGLGRPHRCRAYVRRLAAEALGAIANGFPRPYRARLPALRAAGGLPPSR